MGKTLGDMRTERGGGGPPMLHGSDLNKTEQSIKIKIRELREAPKNFKSPAIIDLAEAIHERNHIAVNTTNLNALAEMAGFEDPLTAPFDQVAAKVKGKTFTMYKTVVNNPTTNKMTYGLAFAPDGK